MDRHTMSICELGTSKYTMTHVNAFSVSNDIGRISSNALRAIAHGTTMRAIAPVAIMRAITHVATTRTVIELLNDVDDPVPRAAQRRTVPLALRVVLAPYDVHRARPVKAQHTKA